MVKIDVERLKNDPENEVIADFFVNSFKNGPNLTFWLTKKPKMNLKMTKNCPKMALKLRQKITLKY